MIKTEKFLAAQRKTPYLTAYKNYMKTPIAEFDVPGHHGSIRTDFDKVFTHVVYKYDINCPRGMDNILHPTGPLKQAQDLFARACGADHCKFLVNGSTSGNLVMLMSTLKANDKIILPRNVHKSVINGLVLCGAMPVFIMPFIDKNTEIVCQISFNEWKKTIDENPDAKAIFIINPTYFGATCDLKRIVDYAHEKNMIVLVDEAHGSHFYFSNKCPMNAMKAGADMSTLSIHKTGGSLTQTSVLLYKGKRVTKDAVNKSFNLITTTSPNNMLLASLDATRKFLVFKGSKAIYNAIKLARKAKREIDKIPGFKARTKDYFTSECQAFNFDETKICIEIDKIDLSGFEIYKMLRDKYKIQMELGETYVLLALFTIGSRERDVNKLISALEDISKKYYNEDKVYEDHHHMDEFPEMVLRPRSAYQAPAKNVQLKNALGKISKEMIMIYPPGIPVIIPGEVFTKKVIDLILYYQSIKATVLSDLPSTKEVVVIDVKNWNK